MPAAEVLKQLNVNHENGLGGLEVQRRRDLYGENVLEEAGGRPAYRLILNQFSDLLIGLLVVAAALAYYLGDIRGASVLVAIILVNAAIGFFQEQKADRLLDRLKTLISAQATVMRDDARSEVQEIDLVPGDIVFLEAGDAVPADIRLIETFEFATNDVILTGESLPQAKDADYVFEQDTPLTNQDNLAFFGTTVARGSATGVVIATGMTTEIGDIARSGQTITRDLSPLQIEINTLARTLTKLGGVIVIMLFAANLLLRADAFPDTQSLINASILFAIGVAAACVPQGLPAQITVALSLGVGRLARKSAVVKRLSAVETLGSTTVICSDKTGTITTNQMTIIRCWTDGRTFEVTGEGYDPNGEILEGGSPVEKVPAIQGFFEHGFLASEGRTHPPDDQHLDWYAVGDPTEAAFMPLAIKAGIDPEESAKALPVLTVLPFDGRRKRMTVIRQREGQSVGYMKGATSSVLDSCTAIRQRGSVTPLNDEAREEVLSQTAAFSAASLRVIALAYRDFPKGRTDFPLSETEREFVFAGLVAMLDPPRPGVAEAIEDMRDAHVRVFMLTGDGPITAEAIAERIGMPDGSVITGDSLQSMSDEELTSKLGAPSLIFSRVSPRDKLRVVNLLKDLGEVVAVTGDGVNDTLSLKRADIGVAMGKQGTDVAKEAAEIVLVDDDFTTLVDAVREGRTIFQNLKSIILSSMTSNIGELTCVCIGFVGVAFGLPIPITAVQILSVDLIGEMLPLMALTYDPAEHTMMQQPPRKLGAHIIDGRRMAELLLFGILMGAVGYGSFFMVLTEGGSTGQAQAAAYTSIVLAQYANILSRRTSNSIYGRYLFLNRRLWIALIISLLAVCTIVTVPGIGAWFGFEPLSMTHWVWPVMGCIVVLICFEALKLLTRARTA